MLRVILYLAPLPLVLSVWWVALSLLPTTWSQALQPYSWLVVIALLAPLARKSLRGRRNRRASASRPAAAAGVDGRLRDTAEEATRTSP